jgi:alkylation response protein AidB-like acyl-CoA dehydrogenase
MDFAFTDEQEALRRALRDVAADRSPSARRREVIEHGAGHDDDLWALLTRDLAVAGVAVREEHGGTGGTFVDAAVVIEEAGAALLPVPVLTAVVAALVVDRGDPDLAAQLAPALAAGERGATLVVAPDMVESGMIETGMAGAAGALTGVARHVVAGDRADLLVVAAPGGLWAVDAADAGVAAAATPTLDPTRRQATVTLSGATGLRLGDAAMSAAAVDVYRVALAVEAVGVARTALASTVDHLKTRVQFGRPIGAFQALQHRAADLAVELAAATSAAYYAAWVAADSPAELAMVAPLAKAVCADAAYRVTAESIQLHGGIGFTWEHDAHLYFKRATVTRLLLGDSLAQRRLVAERAGLNLAGAGAVHKDGGSAA